MDTKELQKEDRVIRNKLPIRIVLSVLFCFLMMYVFCRIMDIRPTVFYPLDGNMSAEVTYEDGTTAYFDDGNFGVVNLGDTVEFHVKFPESYGIKAAELFIPLHNVILNVEMEKYGVLYRDNINMEDLYKHYGNRIYEIQLPGGFESKGMTIEMIPRARFTYSDMKNSGVIPANEGWKQIITGHTLSFLSFITLMIMAFIFICYFIVKSIETRKLQIGLSIAIFEMMISGWYFGSLGMFYLFVEDIPFCAKIEYYSLYLAPIPLTVFIYQVLDKPVMKKLVSFVGSLYAVFYVAATLVERWPGLGNYSHMLPGMHLLLGMTIICLVIAIFGGIQMDKNSYVYILRFGILMAMFCGLAELLRFNIVKYVMDESWITTKGLSGIAIMTVAVSLVVYLISYTTNEFAIKIERQQLLKLAYQDALTGMPNRADCYRNIEAMEKKGVKEYTMIFIDLNDLKLANDKWGHDMGDKLLKVTADSVVEAFADGGFVSRWGGDEFVACVMEKNEKVLERIGVFENKMKAWDASGELPLKVSAACGWVCSTAERYLPPIDAIRYADEEMYGNKRIMKEAKA